MKILFSTEVHHMELTRTINCDKRYYIDEGLMENPKPFLETMRLFNAAKIDLYNALYDLKFLSRGPLQKQNYPAYLKEKYQLNDYYNSAIYTAASGQLSSQKELRKLYQTTVTTDIETRTKKISSIQEELDKKCAVKDSIRTYARTKKWIKPYPKCQLKVSGQDIHLPGGKRIPIKEYERTVEGIIRNLKTKLALTKEARKRKERKLNNLMTKVPKRIIFGTKYLYTQKDVCADPETRKATNFWKQEFSDKRCQSMSLPGRHTSKHGNFLCKYENGTLYVTCANGAVTTFHYFELTRYQEQFLANFSCDPKTRQSICYNFELKRDHDGRQYLIVSVTLKLQSDGNFYYENGAVSMDINYDHFALSELDEKGNLLDTKMIRFDLIGKTTGQNTNILGMAVKEVFDWCEQKDKRLIVEDIDLTIKLASRKYGNRTGNHHMTLFAYQKIAACIANQSFRRHIAFRKINPAYTSQIGKFLYMRTYGISIHQAASYVIGLVGLGLFERLKPDVQMLELMKNKEGIIPVVNEETYQNIWRRISGTFYGIPKYLFYREIPYDVLKKKKRPSLKTLAAEMRSWIKDPEFCIL